MDREQRQQGHGSGYESSGPVRQNGIISVVALAFLCVDPDAMHRCGYQTLSDDVRRRLDLPGYGNSRQPHLRYPA